MTLAEAHHSCVGRPGRKHFHFRAEVILFFASDLSKAVTGQTLDVNAGSYFG